MENIPVPLLTKLAPGFHAIRIDLAMGEASDVREKVEGTSIGFRVKVKVTSTS
jgi:hypothetical protein